MMTLVKQKAEEKFDDGIQVIMAPRIRRPRIYEQGFNVLMWVLGSIFVLIEIDLKENLSGVILRLPMTEVILMLVSTILLSRGLKDGCWPFVVPWVLLSSRHCYSNHFQDIVQIYNVFLMHEFCCLPWMMLACYVVALFLRVYMIVTIIIVTLQQWYNQQLLKQMTD